MPSLLGILVLVFFAAVKGKDQLLERRKAESYESEKTITNESIRFINLCNHDRNLPKIRELLEMPEVDLNAMEPRRHRTALMMAVTFFEQADDVLRLLLSQPGLDYNRENYLGKTALHYAAENSNVLAVHWLIKFKDIRINHQAFG